MIPILLEITNYGWIENVIQFGLGGVVLMWFMLRMEPRMRAVEESIDTISRSMLLLAVSLAPHTEAIKQQAKKIEEDLDAAARERDKK